MCCALLEGWELAGAWRLINAQQPLLCAYFYTLSVVIVIAAFFTTAFPQRNADE